MKMCAEIPDENEDPEVYEVVKTCMMHGPCRERDPKCQCTENVCLYVSSVKPEGNLNGRLLH